MTASLAARRRHVGEQAGPHAEVERWREGVRQRTRIECRLCTPPALHVVLASTSAAALDGWAVHVRTVHPEVLPTLRWAVREGRCSA